MSRRLNVQRQPYNAADFERFNSIVTTRDPKTGELRRCTVPGCGEVIEVLWQHLGDVADGLITRCAECRGDHELLDLQRPSPHDVKRLSVLRAASLPVPDDRRIRRTA